mgnify:CR=1 FL=1
MSFKYKRVNPTLFFTLYILVIIFFSIISYNFFIRDYVELEYKQNQSNINTILTAINSNISNIRSFTHDYSKWDDTYDFINDVNQGYIYENFREGTETLKDLDIEFFIYANLQQKSIFSVYTNESLEKVKIDFEKKVLNSFKNDTVNTIFKYNKKNYYLIKSKINKSDGSAISNGYIYSGKRITNENINALTNVFKKVYISNRFSKKFDLKLEFKYLNNIRVRIDQTNENLINNIQILDVDNNYVFSVITENSKEILRNGQKNIFIFNLIISIFLFILLFVLYRNQRILERLVDEKSKKIIEKQKIIAHQSKMVAMAEILENIAHQWRQPLNVITTVSSGVKLNKELGLLEEQALFESMDAITNSAQYLSKTINTLKNFQNKNTKNEVLSLSGIIEKSISLINLNLVDKNINMTLNIQDISVYGVENELIQVLLSIINNSIDAFENEKSNVEKLIVISILMENDYVVINIKDNAGGIPIDLIERVFEPYFTTKHKSQGTGIGLYISFEIITKNMNGELLVKNSEFNMDSKNYKGAEFTIKLPFGS